MGYVANKATRLETVGAVIDALSKFPRDMPIEVGMDDMAQVYKVTPQKGETVSDRRGRICIDGDHGQDYLTEA